MQPHARSNPVLAPPWSEPAPSRPPARPLRDQHQLVQAHPGRQARLDRVAGVRAPQGAQLQRQLVAGQPALPVQVQGIQVGATRGGRPAEEGLQSGVGLPGRQKL